MPLTALIIEDNPLLREILRLKFEHRGWTVAEAGDAYRGLTLFRELVPQLVTLDLIMPINDGIDSVQMARVIIEEYPETAVFVLSALGAEPRINKFFKEHGVEVFNKVSSDNRGVTKLFETVDAHFKKLTDHKTSNNRRHGSEDQTKWTS
jgi:two-component system chemotaxis response regulator CheY